MTKFSNKLKKPCFWSIFGPFSQFWGQKKKKKFPENPVLSRKTSQGILALCQNLEKINDTIPRKHPNRRKDGSTDRQILFYRTLPATARGPINNPFYI